jgi:hypothetical protein
MAITIQALSWGMSPWPVAQKTHLVNGSLGYEAQLVNAVITTMAPTKDRLHFAWFGPWEKIVGQFKTLEGKNGRYQVPGWTSSDEAGCGVKVWATLKGEEEPRELSLLLQQATVRNSTLWACDPKQQLAYLATKRWSRLYTPDVIMGVYTPDELIEVREINITSEVTDVTTEEGGQTDTGEYLKKLKQAQKQAASARRAKAQAEPQPTDETPVPKEEEIATAPKPNPEPVPGPAPTQGEQLAPALEVVTSQHVSAALGIPATIIDEYFRNHENPEWRVARGIFQLPNEKRHALIEKAAGTAKAIKAWVEARDNAPERQDSQQQ